MANALFNLKKPESKDKLKTKDKKENEKTLIFLIFRYENKKFKYSTGINILPKLWNPELQQARLVREFLLEGMEINTTLSNYKALVGNIYRQIKNDGKIVTNELLKAGMDKALQKSNAIEKGNFIAFVDASINNSIKRPNTIKHYNQTLRLLKEYKEHSKKELTFDDINLDFYENFTKFCLKKKYSNNTLGGFIKHVKVFMNEAFDRKLTNNIEFKSKKFKTIEEETENIYLTISEIEAIYKHDLSENKRLDLVRDMFVISCYTGLRYSDLMQLSNMNLIDKNTKLKIKTEKTGEIVIIPLNKHIREILKKHDGLPSYSITNQKMNEYLKELAELVKLNDKVVLSSTKGGIKTEESFFKYNLVTVHTARRSFATNAYLMDVPSISIMKITGHRTEKAFLKYIKISQEENANKLASHPFFGN